MTTKKSALSFLKWLEKNDPFVYDVVAKDLEKKGIALAGWEDILENIGSAVGKIGTAYLGYRASKSAIKVQEMQAKYLGTYKDVAPTPNTAALTEIQKRLLLAEQNRLQPNVPYYPYINPNKIANYPVAVAKTSSLLSMENTGKLMVVGGLGLMLVLLRKKRK